MPFYGRYRKKKGYEEEKKSPEYSDLGDYIKVVHATSSSVSVPSLASKTFNLQKDIPDGYTPIGVLTTGVGTSVGIVLQAIDIGFVRVYNTTTAAAGCSPTQDILCIKIITPTKSG